MNRQEGIAQSWDTVGSSGFSAGSYAGYIYMTMDGIGTPYVVFQEGSSDKATVMKYSGLMWEIVGIPEFSGGLVEGYQWIAIDRSGTPYVAFLDNINSNKATVMKYNGSSWINIGSPGFSAGGAASTSIAIDTGGTPYVVYEDVPIGGTIYGPATVMKYNGSSWVNVGSPGFSAGSAFFTSIAIDNNGEIYVAYEDGQYGPATVMKYNGSSWVTVGSADFSAGEAEYTSIAIWNDTPYVVYSDGATSIPGQATVMKYNGSNWVNVGSAGFSGGEAVYTSIAIDGSGTLYVVYTDYFYHGVTVTKFNGSNWDTVGAPGFGGDCDYTSIAINSSGIPYVAYQNVDGAATVMDFGTGSGSGTSVKEVNSTNNIQIYPTPLSTTVHIKAPEKVNVTILNMVGQVVIEQQNTTDINMSSIPNGVYIIKVYDENNLLLKTEKLVKAE